MPQETPFDDRLLQRNRRRADTFWDRAAEQNYGWWRDEPVGRNADALLRARYSQEREAVEAQLLSGGSWTGELVQQTHDGASITVASRWAAQRDRLGEPLAVIETHTDITERKRAREALSRGPH